MTQKKYLRSVLPLTKAKALTFVQWTLCPYGAKAKTLTSFQSKSMVWLEKRRNLQYGFWQKEGKLLWQKMHLSIWCWCWGRIRVVARIGEHGMQGVLGSWGLSVASVGCLICPSWMSKPVLDFRNGRCRNQAHVRYQVRQTHYHWSGLCGHVCQRHRLRVLNTLFLGCCSGKNGPAKLEQIGCWYGWEAVSSWCWSDWRQETAENARYGMARRLRLGRFCGVAEKSQIIWRLKVKKVMCF